MSKSSAIPRSQVRRSSEFSRLSFRSLALKKLDANLAVRLFIAALMLYVAVYFAASAYKFMTLRQGFDLAQNEQTIWNTAHGRFFQTSPFGELKYDFDDGIVPFQLLLAVPYAIAPTTYTLLFLQTLALAAGAIPIFLLARSKLNAWLALCFALAYFFHVTVTRMNLYEFQLRSFVLVFFLFAFYFFEKNRFGLFLLFALLMLSVKTEVALTLPMFGVYAWLEKKSLRWILTPIVLGFGYFAFVFGIIMPAFAPRDLIGSAYGYSWLGNNFGEMFVTLVTKPLYVAQFALAPDKLVYLAQSFLLLLFLPLLKPRLLLFALPSLFLNLLAARAVQYSVLFFYQPFVIGAFFLAAIYGMADTLPRWFGARAQTLQVALALVLVLASIGFNLTWHNLLGRAFTRPESVERQNAAHRIMAQIPANASVAASSFLAPHLAQREQLYFFPGTASYPFLPERVEYVAADLQLDNSVHAQKILAVLMADTQWQVIARDTDYLLVQRRAAP